MTLCAIGFFARSNENHPTVTCEPSRKCATESRGGRAYIDAAAPNRYTSHLSAVCFLERRTRCNEPSILSPPRALLRGTKREFRTLDGLHFVGLQALLALHDLERHALAFLQGLEARALDRAEVHEQVRTRFRVMKPKPLASLNHLTVPV